MRIQTLKILEYFGLSSWLSLLFRNWFLAARFMLIHTLPTRTTGTLLLGRLTALEQPASRRSRLCSLRDSRLS